MYERALYGHLLIAIFSNQVGPKDHEEFAADISKFLNSVGDLFVIALVKPNSEYPKTIAELIEIFMVNARVMRKVRRFYGLRHHPVLSFISGVVIKILGIDPITTEAATIEELIQLIKADAQTYPNLNASLYNWDCIEAEIGVARQ